MLRSQFEDSIRFKKWQMSRYLPDNEGKKPQLAVGSEDGDMESVIWYLALSSLLPGRPVLIFSYSHFLFKPHQRHYDADTRGRAAGQNKYIIKVLRYTYKCGSKIIL